MTGAIDKPNITVLLRAWRDGSSGAGEELSRVVHTELRQIAAAFWRRELRTPTLDPTEIVHEAWIELLGGNQPEWQDRRHFYGIAARLMRQILIREARRRKRLKRGSGQPNIPLSDIMLASPDIDIDVLALEIALEQLEQIDPVAVRLVELRFFAGLSIDQSAQLLELGRATVVRKWRAARVWLKDRLDHE